MNKIQSKPLLVSVNKATGDVLYTFVWTYPRFILAEVNTHRKFSRNTASSRAIPTKKLRQMVRKNPVTPVSIRYNQKGMQGGAEIRGWRRQACEFLWHLPRYVSLFSNWAMEKLGAHKQIPNRLLEPWCWTEQLVSCTDINNFIGLRDHHMAEPHLQILAKQVHNQVREIRRFIKWADGYNRHEPTPLNKRVEFHYGDVVIPIQWLEPGEWHLPFIDEEDQFDQCRDSREERSTETLKKISAARSARVSYLLPETGRRSDVQRDIERSDSLFGSHPKHLSPAEHVAMATQSAEYIGNFKGFMQYRKEFQGEEGE